jgi:hypothetical protein
MNISSGIKHENRYRTLVKFGLGYLFFVVSACALVMVILVRHRPHGSFQFRMRYAMMRRMIRTEGKRYIGLASGDVRLGDEVWLLEGSSDPLILRRENDVYRKFIGDAYIHGIMYGEAFQRSACENLLLR